MAVILNGDPRIMMDLRISPFQITDTVYQLFPPELFTDTHTTLIIVSLVRNWSL